MREETMQYLLTLQSKVNEKDSTFIEPNEDFNRGYIQGKKLATNDIITAIKKLEVATE